MLANAAEIARAQTTHSRFPGISRMVGWSALAIAALVIAYLLRPTVPPPQVIGMRQLTHDLTIKLILRVAAMPPEMFTDGSRVYFGEGDTLQNKVMQVSTMGASRSKYRSLSILWGWRTSLYRNRKCCCSHRST